MPLFRRSVVPEAVTTGEENPKLSYLTNRCSYPPQLTTVEEPYYPPPPGPPPPLTDEERADQAQLLADQEKLLAAFDGQLPPTSDIYPPPPGPPPPLEECLYPENFEKYQKRSVTASLIRLSRPIFTFALLVLTCIGINEKFPHHPIVKHAKFVHNEAVGALNGEHSYKITVSKEAKEKTYPYSHQDLVEETENKEEVEKETKEEYQEELEAKFKLDPNRANSDETKAESKSADTKATEEKGKKDKQKENDSKKKENKKDDVKADGKKEDANSKKEKKKDKSADDKGKKDKQKEADGKKWNKCSGKWQPSPCTDKKENKKDDKKDDKRDNKKKDKK